MDYVKIPQNVRVEDKLIGPLSLRQIIIIAVGGGISYTLFAILSKTYGAVPMFAHAFIWLPLIFCVAISLVRINNISLIRYSFLSLEMMIKPRKRVWQPRRGLNILPRVITSKRKKGSKYMNEDQTKEDEIIEQISKAKSDFHLEDLSVILDRKDNTVEKPIVSSNSIL